MSITRIQKKLSESPVILLPYTEEFQESFRNKPDIFRAISWRARRSHTAILRLARIAGITGLDCLDPMCGSGTIPIMLQSLGNRAVAMDINAYAVAQIREALNGPFELPSINVTCPSCGGDYAVRAVVRVLPSRCNSCGSLMFNTNSNSIPPYTFCGHCGAVGVAGERCPGCSARIDRVVFKAKKAQFLACTNCGKKIKTTELQAADPVYTAIGACQCGFEQPIQISGTTFSDWCDVISSASQVWGMRFSDGQPASTVNGKISSYHVRGGWTPVVTVHYIPGEEDINLLSRARTWAEQHKALGVNVMQGNAAQMPFSDGSFDLVFTDPPYFDVFDYSDLPGAEDEQVACDRQIGYQEGMTRIFSEAYRVTREPGMLIFTFHHSNPEAWEQILSAARDSGWHLVNALLYSGESSGSCRRHSELDVFWVWSKRPEPRFLPSKSTDEFYRELFSSAARWLAKPHEYDKLVCLGVAIALSNSSFETELWRKPSRPNPDRFTSMNLEV